MSSKKTVRYGLWELHGRAPRRGVAPRARALTQAVCARATLQKKAQESINARLKLVIKSGKYNLGTKSTIKTLRSGKGPSRGPLRPVKHRAPPLPAPASLHAPPLTPRPRSQAHPRFQQLPCPPEVRD